MGEEKTNALIIRPSEAIEKTSTGARDILSTIVSDALELARRNSSTEARFRIGNYDLREPDYRQILLWANALNLEAAEIIRRMKMGRDETMLSAHSRLSQYGRESYYGLESIETRIEDGSIVTLVWDFSLLPLTEFWWVDGLGIREASFIGRSPSPPCLQLKLPLLTFLKCRDLGLTEIDLSFVPRLTKLWCDDNQLTNLDLSHVPELTRLGCSDNQLTELDLSRVDNLYWLWCSSNQLTNLDLSSIPRLTVLDCSCNQLSELNFPVDSDLTNLICFNNQLTTLDLSHVTKLIELDCSENQLDELDIRPLKILEGFVECDPSVTVIKRPDQKV